MTVWVGYTHRFLLPLFLLYFLPSSNSIFEVVSFFLILPVLLSPLQLVIYSVWWCCLFRVFMQLFHADVYRVYCRLYYVVLNHSKSVELYIRLLTMLRDSGLCTFPISAFQKKSLKFSHLLSSAGGHYILVSCCLLKVLQLFYLHLKSLLFLHVYLSSFRRLEVLGAVVLIRPPSSNQWQLTAIPLLSPWSTFTNCSVYASLTLAHS